MQKTERIVFSLVCLNGGYMDGGRTLEEDGDVGLPMARWHIIT